MGLSVSFVPRRSRAKNQSSGGASLHSLPASEFSPASPCTHLTISSPLLKKRNSECPCIANTRRLIARSSIWIRFLNLSDGSPYCTPPSNVIIWEFPQGVSGVSVHGLAITSSRVMLHVSCLEVQVQQEDLNVGRVFVWDWKTGDLVRLLRPKSPYFSHFTFSGTQPSVHGWEYGGRTEYQCHLPRRISNGGFNPKNHLKPPWVHLIRHARPTRPLGEFTTVPPTAEVPRLDPFCARRWRQVFGHVGPR